MERSSFEAKADVYRAVTDRIIEAIEAGAGEFLMPWHGVSPGTGLPTNAATGKRYRGTNVLALWAEGSLAGHGSGYWGTYRQWQSLGAQVRRGERSATIVFYKPLAAEEDQDQPRKRLFARASRVFNASQVDEWKSPEVDRPNLAETLAAVEAFVGSVGGDIRHGFDHACYNLALDRIELPDRDRFAGTPTSSATEAYYATALHELTHWTGAPRRLKREFGKRFGDEAYAMEELVAELGAAFLCAEVGISASPRPDHAAYVAHWLEVLRGDRRAIFTAAQAAQEAVGFLRPVSE